MKFKLALLTVQDVERSKKFYHDFFDQIVVLDLGWNVTFSGGFAIQQNFSWLTNVPPESVIQKSHNMELYFEVDDFDTFLAKLDAQPEVTLVHPPKKYDWQQRVVRVYDPDFHIIEAGESMAVIAKRFMAEGNSIEQTAELIQHPVEFVRSIVEGKDNE